MEQIQEALKFLEKLKAEIDHEIESSVESKKYEKSAVLRDLKKDVNRTILKLNKAEI